MIFERFMDHTPEVHFMPDFDPNPSTDWYGIKALWYEGPQYKQHKTKVFAYIGYPQAKPGQKVPAVVLVHGGGGHAYPEWIRRWNEKGFAAIAMDTTGFLPSEQWKGLAGTEEHIEGQYVQELYGELAESGYVLGPNNSEMTDYDLPLEEQWMYHAVADTILAHNILIADNNVDASKIGIVGISWGAVITALAIGYDIRYAFAVPIYGSGYIDCIPGPTKIPSRFRILSVKENWSASDRFNHINCPVLWQCWRPDPCFSLEGNSLSYKATKKANSFFSISPDMHHSHWHGWHALENYRFAQRIVNNELPLIRASEDPKDFNAFSFTLDIPEDFSDVRVQIVYSETPLNYGEDGEMTNEWKIHPVTISGNAVTGQSPVSASCYYVEMSGKADDTSYLSSTALVHRSN